MATPDWHDLAMSLEYLARRGLAGEIAQYARDHLNQQRISECTTAELQQILDEMRRCYPQVDNWLANRSETVL